MTSLEDRPTPTATFDHYNRAGALDRWQGQGAYANHVAEVAKASRAKCGKGAGQCCLMLSLNKFEIGERLTEATVSGSCTAGDCPDPKVVFDAVFNVAGPSDGLPHASRYGHEA